MHGQEAAPGLRCNRVPCDDPEIAVFGISGSLGPGAKPILGRLFERCMQYELRKVVLDLSGLESLGGGGARQLTEFAARRRERGWRTAFIVVSPTVRRFLSLDPTLEPPPVVRDLEGALAVMRDASPRVEPRGAPPRGAAGDAGSERQVEGLGLAQLLVAIGLDRAQGTDEAHEASRLSSRAAVREAPGSMTADEDPGDVEQAAARWRRHLGGLGLASRVHVFALQPDGVYHPVTMAGIDLDRGLPYHGLLASRVRDQQGPSFLFDLCIEPLTDEEQDLLTSLDSEVVARTGGGEMPELLLFLAKGGAGDEYTLEDLHTLQQLLVDGLPRAVEGSQASQETRQDGAWEEPASHSVASWHEPERSGVMGFGAWASPERPLRQEHPLPSPASVLGQAAYEESGRERLLRRKLTQLRDILNLSRDFDASFGTARILEVLVLAVVSVARTETVLFLSERDGEFHLTHHRGLDRSALAEMALRVDSTLVQAALRSDAPLRIEESEGISEEEKIWARQHRFPYVVSFRSRERILGVLFLGESRSGEMDLEMLLSLLQEAALAYERALLFETLHGHTLGVVRGLVTLIETCSGQDASSTERVVRYTQALAREVDFPEGLRRDLSYGAVLRDVGMLRIDPAILRTSGQLTPAQWDLVQRHPVDGAAIMRQMHFSDVAIEVVMHHHEAYNGEGYPAGLRGRAIPLGARIVAVAESYVKMTMDRSYRKALGRVEALESMAENWGLRYDPLIVDALVRVVNRELSIGLEGETEFARDLFGV